MLPRLALSASLLLALNGCPAAECAVDSDCTLGMACFEGACVRAYAPADDAAVAPDAAPGDAAPGVPDAGVRDSGATDAMSADARPIERDAAAPDAMPDSGTTLGRTYRAAFNEAEALLVLDLAPDGIHGVSYTTVRGSVGAPAWSADARLAALGTRALEFFVVQPDLSLSAGPFRGAEPVFAPDGSDALLSVEQAQLCVTFALGPTSCNPLGMMGQARRPLWAETATTAWILLTQSNPGPADAFAVPVGAPGNDLSPIATGVQDLAVLANNRRELLGLVGAGGVCELVVLAPARRPLVTDVPCNARIAPAPSGQAVAVLVGQGTSSLYRIPAGAAAAVPLNRFIPQLVTWPVGQVGWSPDSAYVVLSVDRGMAQPAVWDLYFTSPSGDVLVPVAVPGPGRFALAPL